MFLVTKFEVWSYSIVPLEVREKGDDQIDHIHYYDMIQPQNVDLIIVICLMVCNLHLLVDNR